MVGSIYILQSETNGSFYIGSSLDTKTRLLEHNSGKTIATRNKGPWKIIYQQKYSSITLARQIEYKLKKMKSRKILEKIVKDGYIKIKIKYTGD